MVSRSMRSSFWARIGIVVLVTGAVLAAARGRDAQLLQKAKPQRGVLEANAALRFKLSLAQRDCALGKLEPWAGGGKAASELHLSVIDPATDKPVRVFRSGDFGFCVEAAGSYALELRAAAEGGFELTLDAVLARAVPRPSSHSEGAQPLSPMSPRLRALAEQLADPQQLDQFWTEAVRAGTPLIEPSDDADSSWVTFLYRGNLARAPAVSWQMWTFELENTELARLPGTDLWWKSVRFPNSTRFSYQLAIDPPPLPAASTELAERARDAVTQVDPNNHVPMTRDAKLDMYAQRSVVQLSAAERERWLDARAAPAQAARGRIEQRSLLSRALGHTHQLSLYLPAGYDAERRRSYPLLIFFDGGSYLNDVPTPRLLDALISAHAIVPVVALFVHDDAPSQRASELPCNPRFAAFVAEELLPFARVQLRVTDDAAQIGLAGSSFGGLASSFIALQYPERFGKVLSQSGSYWWSFPAKHPQFDGSDKPGWLRRRFAEKPPTATQFYLSAGSFEGAPEGQGVLDQNRQQRDTLRALGYSVAYQEFTGGHDYLAWRATLPDALIALYAPER